jgi:iron complex outermembrane receptor protein
VIITTRKFTYHPLLALALIVAGLARSDCASARDESLWEMSLEQLGQVRITTLASGTATPLDKAAAVTTVITEADIIAMGATDIDQILETVPGLHVGISDQGYAPKFIIRGISSSSNAQTLMLINGIPVTDLVFGNRGNVWAGMPVKAIARIEVIRGPGSAVYGADAFAGVINIITKGRKDIDGTQAGYRRGSFDTEAAWVAHGQSFGALDLGLVLEYQGTDGHAERVQADVLGQSGPVSTMWNAIDARIDLSWHRSRLRLGVQDRSHIGTGVGVLPILDPKGRFASERFNADYTYRDEAFATGLEFEAQLSYYLNSQQVEDNILLAPPLAFPGFPDGFIGNPGFREEQARADLGLVCRGFEDHILRLGAGAHWGDVFETTESKNFNPDNSPRAGGIEDVSDTAEVWLPERDRTGTHIFLQDEWRLAQDWQLTSGIRFDEYSDFGDTANPRMALVWAVSDAITTKLLYGRAFRAPAISELFVTSNPVALGDAALRPETIDTYELALFHRWSRALNYSANIYHYRISDLIVLSPIGSNKQWRNAGERNGQGIEFELDYRPSSQLRLLANVVWQQAEDESTGEDVGDAPVHQLYARAEWRVADKWLVSPQLNWVGTQKRVPEDSTRSEDVPHYTTIDFTVRQLNVVDHLDVAVSVHNIFDRTVLEPSPISPLPFGGPASDFPRAGRNIYFELSYSF